MISEYLIKRRWIEAEIFTIDYVHTQRFYLSYRGTLRSNGLVLFSKSKIMFVVRRNLPIVRRTRDKREKPVELCLRSRTFVL